MFRSDLFTGTDLNIHTTNFTHHCRFSFDSDWLISRLCDTLDQIILKEVVQSCHILHPSNQRIRAALHGLSKVEIFNNKINSIRNEAASAAARGCTHQCVAADAAAALYPFGSATYMPPNEVGNRRIVRATTLSVPPVDTPCY